MLHALGMFVAGAGRLAPRQLRRLRRPELAHDQFQIARVGGRLQRCDNLMVSSERSREATDTVRIMLRTTFLPLSHSQAGRGWSHPRWGGGSALITEERCDLVIKPISVELPGELHQLMLHVDDLVEPRSE